MYFIGLGILECAGLLFILLAAVPLYSSDYVSEESARPALIPDTNKLTIVSFSTVGIGNDLRAVVVYDDPATKRPVDYVALYDRTGELLALTWFDRFGIERMAVDRGLLDNTSHREGVFVGFLTGDSL